jgi:hypothetical protein
VRKILLLVIAFLMISCTCLAAGTKVCVIADIPMVLKNDKAVLAEIDTNVRKVFRPYKFDITPSLEETLLHVRQYRQDNGLIAPNGGGAFLKTKDVQNIGNLLKADYVFHIEAFIQSIPVLTILGLVIANFLLCYILTALISRNKIGKLLLG